MGMASGGHCHGQGPFWGGAIGPNPTDRAKNGTKRSVLTEGAGGPVAVVVAPANVHDTKLLKATLEAIIVERPKPTRRRRQHLCLDKAYDNPTGHTTVAGTDYVPHIRPIGEEPSKRQKRKYPARRWVVERTLAWLSKCRAILVRYDKAPENYRGLLQFACALIWFRRLVYKTGATHF
jgi:putative transposase